MGLDDEVVENATFEKAVVNIQGDHEKEMTATKLRAVRHLLKDKNITPSPENNEGRPAKIISLSQEILNEELEETPALIPNNLIFALSVQIQIFSRDSVAGYALIYRRRGVLRANIEIQLFIHVNSSLWGLKNLAEVML